MSPEEAPEPPITLTPEEAALVIKLVRYGFNADGSDDGPADALAARLEAVL